jgi:hypothetical protein
MRIRREDIVSVDLGVPSDDDARGGEIYKTNLTDPLFSDLGI